MGGRGPFGPSSCTVSRGIRAPSRGVSETATARMPWSRVLSMGRVRMASAHHRAARSLEASAQPNRILDRGMAQTIETKMFSVKTI
jgi:hypothetical protein